MDDGDLETSKLFLERRTVTLTTFSIINLNLYFNCIPFVSEAHHIMASKLVSIVLKVIT